LNDAKLKLADLSKKAHAIVSEYIKGNKITNRKNYHPPEDINLIEKRIDDLVTYFLQKRDVL
jgi:hypothetical protein